MPDSYAARYELPALRIATTTCMAEFSRLMDQASMAWDEMRFTHLEPFFPTHGYGYVILSYGPRQ
jgi:hypothetical protein